MKKLLFLLTLLLGAQAAQATTWFVRADGGTRYSANVPTGQCNGTTDAAYPGTGFNQNCAFNDVRYLWDDGSYGNFAWVIAGGDTVVIRSCAAAGDQQNPDNPHCRIGWDTASGTGSKGWCAGHSSNIDCNIPPPPNGTSVAHTKILGGCAYGSYTCNSGTTTTRSNLAVLFGGFGLGTVLDLTHANYIDVEGIEITTHNGSCTEYGSPAGNHSCVNSTPADDYAKEGIATAATTTNLLLQDVYVDGFSKGIHGPIGANITLTRVNVSFNGFAGWDMDTASASNGPNASLIQSYVTMIGNGCYQEWPIVHTGFPARACYDTNDGGFGDAWSGQSCSTSDPNCSFLTITCDHCLVAYNTKDGFFGPHTLIKNLSITNSQWYGNMGSQIKWGTQPNATVLFQNNYVNGNCFAMSQQLPGAAQNFNQSTGLTGSYLTGWCRAAGAPFAISTSGNTSFLFAGNTIVSNIAQTTLQMSCVTAGTCSTTTWQFTDNLFLGYTPPAGYGPYGGGYLPAIYFTDDFPATDMVVNSSHNLFYGNRNDDCTGAPGSITLTSTAKICADPHLTGEPAQGAYPPESVFYSFDLHPSTDSPALNAGIAVSGMTTDIYGVARPNPPSIGAAEFGGTPTAAAPTYSPVAGTYPTTQSVTLSTASPGCSASIVWNTTNAQSGGNLTGTTTGTSVTVSASETVYSQVQGCSGFANSTISSAAYVIAPLAATPTCSPAAGTYGSAQTVTCSSTTPSSTTRCTTNGSTPTGSSPVCTSIAVGSSLTLKAIAQASGYTDSLVDTENYIISIPTTSSTTITGNATLSGTFTIQ